jgi:Uma2 family endonuclease
MVKTPQIQPYVDYPDSDGQPMTESDPTRNYLVYCVEALRLFFQSRPQVYVSGNLFIYYQEGDPAKSVSPDVFVVFGVSKRERRSYKVWEEDGKLPSFILEITSMTTRKQDEETKPNLYASLGVQEYFQYDPTGDYLNLQLKGRQLRNGSYQAIAPQSLDDGSIAIYSSVLGLDLRLLPVAAELPPQIRSGTTTARELRLFDPQTQTKLLNYQEAEQARQQAEQARQQAELSAEEERQRAERAEQRLAELLAQLQAKGIDPER